MKVAQTSAGLLISAQEAIKSSAAAEYYCPKCQQLVQLNQGCHNAPYFKHCHVQNGGGGESPGHLLGKMAIANLAQSLQWATDFEVRVNPTQRADVLLTQQKRQMVVEYQCSPLQPTALLARTTGYQQCGLPVFWVVGQRYQFKQRHLSQQQLAFLRYRPQWGFYLLCYLAQAKQWVLYHHVCAYEFYGYTWQTRYLTNTALARLLMGGGYLGTSPQKKQAIGLQKRQLAIRLGHQEAHIMALQQQCYQNGQRVQSAPDWCYHVGAVPPLFTRNQFESRVAWWLSNQPNPPFASFAPRLIQPQLAPTLFAAWAINHLQRALTASKKESGSLDR